MKYSLLILMLFVYLIIRADASYSNGNNSKNNTMKNSKVKMKIKSQTFIVSLLDNNSTKALIGMLPLTMEMIELNGNEKYVDLPHNLPTKSYKPLTIKSGDLMLYGSKTLVLFYKSFSTPYSYTKLGSIDDVTGLTTSLGSENVTVTLELD